MTEKIWRTAEEIRERIKEHEKYKQKVLNIMETNPLEAQGASVGYHAIINQIDDLLWVLGKNDAPDSKDLSFN